MTTIVENSANDDGGVALTNEKDLEKKELETTSAAAATLDSELGVRTSSVVANDEHVAYSEAAVKNPEENDAEMRQSEDVASSFPEKVRSIPSW
jgi:hypothetical protein